MKDKEKREAKELEHVKAQKWDCGPQIFVKTLTGKTVTVGWSSSGPVYALKILLREHTSLDTDQQRIIYKGRQLEDAYTRSEYDIPKESTVHLTLRLRGGMYHESSGRDGFDRNRTIYTSFVRDNKMDNPFCTAFITVNDGTTVGDVQNAILKSFEALGHDPHKLVGATIQFYFAGKFRDLAGFRSNRKRLYNTLLDDGVRKECFRYMFQVSPAHVRMVVKLPK